MVQTIFNGALLSGEWGRLCRRFRRLILKRADPIVTWELNGRKLRLPLSHQLPLHKREFPTYSANFERLAALVRRQQQHLILIDVGANIGDSLALARIGAGDACLLIEGDPAFFRLLQENTADLPEARCVTAMLSDKVGEESVQLVTGGGTGHLVAGERSDRARVLTLDRVIEAQPEFKGAHLLKIDVDGYDFRVLRGGERLVRSAQPILFFEQFPEFLEAADEKPDAVWDWLAAAGYSQLLLYDNFGFFIGSFSSADRAVLSQLNAYARQRPLSYYDVVAFAHRHQEVRNAFVAGEADFYAARS